MTAVDTNILVRYLIRDDKRQTAIADTLLRSSCFIATTVLLETVWVLSSRYRIERTKLVATLSQLLDLPGVSTEAPELIDWAVTRFAAGGDFADMMHLVAARSASGFTTFDLTLADAAGTDTPIPIETLTA